MDGWTKQLYHWMLIGLYILCPKTISSTVMLSNIVTASVQNAFYGTNNSRPCVIKLLFLSRSLSHRPTKYLYRQYFFANFTKRIIFVDGKIRRWRLTTIVVGLSENFTRNSSFSRKGTELQENKWYDIKLSTCILYRPMKTNSSSAGISFWKYTKSFKLSTETGSIRLDSLYRLHTHLHLSWRVGPDPGRRHRPCRPTVFFKN